ncbi:MAG: NAD(P)H-hydrate dehydratase [Bacteroidales bacterium]|nr:NAD(P)H-hydrate dehydratase [Bacteroidales bacterium]MCI1786226.1 NAD(P)H-hydrate dehydratase [Bacteroidales bacterium]
MMIIDEKYLKALISRRKNDTHKGDYGHLLLVCGCDSMPGAAVLAAGAALKSGCGLVTLHSSSIAAQAAVNLFPSAMLSLDKAPYFSEVPDLSRYTAIGAGPGLGRDGNTVRALGTLISKARESRKPMLLDADALNIISQDKRLLNLIPAGSVMTPHNGELKRLIGEWHSDDEKKKDIIALCAKTGCVVVSKGYNTKVFTSSGDRFVNTTGNPGMAKGGSGDVLSGLISGLMARGYAALDAALLGVWIHGTAGDCLTEECTTEAYNSMDMIAFLYKGFRELYNG